MLKICLIMIFNVLSPACKHNTLNTGNRWLFQINECSHIIILLHNIKIFLSFPLFTQFWITWIKTVKRGKKTKKDLDSISILSKFWNNYGLWHLVSKTFRFEFAAWLNSFLKITLFAIITWNYTFNSCSINMT